MNANPIFCAIDVAEPDAALDLARKLRGLVGGIKLGLEFFTANGPAGFRRVAESGTPLFLDLKLHDIPNTVAGGMRGVAALGPAMTTIHATGGAEMMRRAVEAAAEAAKHHKTRPLVLAVTVLTSIDQAMLSHMGIGTGMADLVARLAALAQEAGTDGAVCSPREIEALRRQCGPDFKLIVPGIRPSWAELGDQKRVMGPAGALAAGADYLVIGRPITSAPDPAEAARRILGEIEGKV